jgi:hypothetical protein
MLQKRGAEAAADGMRHEAEIAEVDVGPTRRIELIESCLFAIQIKHVDGDLRVAQHRREFRIRHDAPQPPEIRMADLGLQRAILVVRRRS